MNFVEFTELVIQPNPDRKTMNVQEVKRLIVPEKVISLAPAQVPSKIQTPVPKSGTVISLPGKDVLVADTVDEVLKELGGYVEEQEEDERIGLELEEDE